LRRRRRSFIQLLLLRRWYLPTKRSSQPPHLGFAAFGHLFLPNQMAQANHGSGGGNNKQFPPRSLKDQGWEARI
jgi:hypothetical protein